MGHKWEVQGYPDRVVIEEPHDAVEKGLAGLMVFCLVLASALAEQSPLAAAISMLAFLLGGFALGSRGKEKKLRAMLAYVGYREATYGEWVEPIPKPIDVADQSKASGPDLG